MKTINLSFKTKPKLSEKLPERGLNRYRSIPKTDVEIIHVYSFILPEFEKHPDKEFSFLQSNKGLLDFTDNYTLLHYGNKGLDDFKVYLHYSFYGKMVDLVIFKKNDEILSGILYNHVIYYKPYTWKYNSLFVNVEYLLKGFKFNKKYELNEMNLQKIYVEEYPYYYGILNIDTNNFYFLKSLYYDKDISKYLEVTKFSMEFLKEFYVDETNKIVISPIRFYI